VQLLELVLVLASVLVLKTVRVLTPAVLLHVKLIWVSPEGFCKAVGRPRQKTSFGQT
jgi:hypothetical protein